MNNDLRRLLNIEEAAELLSIKVSRLRTAVFKKEIPYLKIGRLVRFKEQDLIKWVEEQTVKSEEKSWLW